MDDKKKENYLPAISAMLVFYGLILVNFGFACYGFASWLLSKGKIERMSTGVIIWLVFTIFVYLVSFYHIMKELAAEA